MNDYDSTRQAIIASLFSPNCKGSAGQTGQAYIAHCKTWEDVPGSPTGERKPRYILLAVGLSSQVFLHKAKRNGNGSFSIGKTWHVMDLKAVELLESSAFKLTIGSRAYFWLAEDPIQRSQFARALVRAYRQCSGGAQPCLSGLSPDDSNSAAHSAPANRSPGSLSSSLAPIPSTPAPPSARPRLHHPSTPPRSQNSSSAGVRPPAQPGHPSNSLSSTPTRHPIPGRTSSPSSVLPAPSPRIGSGDSGERRRPNLPPAPTSTDSHPQLRNISQVTHPPRASIDEASHSPQPAGPTNNPALGPKMSVSGIGFHRSQLRGPASAQVQDPSSLNRLISSPLGPSFDQPDRTLDQAVPSSQATQALEPEAPSLPVVKTPLSTKDPTEGLSPSRSRKVLQKEAQGTFKEHDGARLPVSKGQNENEVDIPDVLTNVEEMLEGFQWGSILGPSDHRHGTGSGTINQIEHQLLTELKALELAEIHAIIEHDDRVGVIVTYLDESLAELAQMEAVLSLYKTQLNMVDDDVIHIESQNRGLQVQISNQRALMEEIENIMQTIRIPESALDSLVQDPLDSQKGITNLEKAITSLYKAILSVRDLNNVAAVAAASDRKVEEFKRHAQQFCKRVYEFLVVMFKYQSDLILNGLSKTESKSDLQVASHHEMEKYLERYCGLTLFIKEIDGARYQQLCASYFATSSELHKREVGDLIGACRTMVRKPTEEELEATFASPASLSPAGSKTAVGRKPLGKFDRRDKRDDHTKPDGLTAGQALRKFLQVLIPHLQREQNFVVDFLHIQPGSTDGGEILISFADYAGLEGYFRRAAMNNLQESVVNLKFKDILSVMDLIFGFLPGEIKEWIDSMITRDPMHIVSVLVALDVLVNSAKIERNEFIIKMLETQQRKSLSIFERNIKEQLKAIETTRLTVKKRKGVVSFISTFPEFVLRVERQLAIGIGKEGEPEIETATRALVNKQYEQIVQSMFDALQTMARSEAVERPYRPTSGPGNQDDQDKDRLNYHTLIIENMHHFVTRVSRIDSDALKPFLEQARELYDQNLMLYIRLILKRPLGRLIDYFQGVEQLLRTTSPSHISQNSQYTKSALKRTINSIDRKDLKRLIESLSKRIDKHFTDLINVSLEENKVVVDAVWKACEVELVKLVGEWNKLIEKCYGSQSQGPGEAGSGGNLALDFGTDDVRHAFQKYKPTP